LHYWGLLSYIALCLTRVFNNGCRAAQVVIPPTNKTVGDLVNFVGSITNSFYPYFYVPVPLAQRQTNVSINGSPYSGCNNNNSTYMIVSFVQNITGYPPTSVAYVFNNDRICLRRSSQVYSSRCRP
jgi:hypothetical protein